MSLMKQHHCSKDKGIIIMRLSTSNRFNRVHKPSPENKRRCRDNDVEGLVTGAVDVETAPILLGKLRGKY